MVTHFLEFFLLFSHFEKVEYKSVWLAPLVKAPGRIGGIDWAIFFSTEVLIIKCGNYTDLFSSMIHLFHSLRNNKKWVFVTVLAEKAKILERTSCFARMSNCPGQWKISQFLLSDLWLSQRTAYIANTISIHYLKWRFHYKCDYLMIVKRCKHILFVHRATNCHRNWS